MLAPMLSHDEFAQALRTVEVSKLAAITGLSEKTIYRLRNGTNSPTLRTFERCMAGIKALHRAGSIKAV